MIAYPNAKINLGLNIGDTMPDGYHEIVTVMVPVNWCDILEIVPSASGQTSLTLTGNHVDCPPEKNLVMKAFKAFAACVDTPPMDIYLRKIIPDGAGLGGGSSDAAFTLMTLNEMTGRRLSAGELAQLASGIGSDCPFFIYNRPMVATGRGTVLSPVDLGRRSLPEVLIVKPRGSVSTAAAYADVIPSHVTADRLVEELRRPIGEWQGRVTNDFEGSVIGKVPEIGEIRDWMIASGAEYSAMTGSGSAVFGIFRPDKLAEIATLPVDGCVAQWCGEVVL